MKRGTLTVIRKSSGRKSVRNAIASLAVVTGAFFVVILCTHWLITVQDSEPNSHSHEYELKKWSASADDRSGSKISNIFADIGSALVKNSGFGSTGMKKELELLVTDDDLISLVKQKLVPPADSGSFNPMHRPGDHDYLPGTDYKKEFLDNYIVRDSGFFIEFGAGDGEEVSQTLVLERKRKRRGSNSKVYTGLLIEPNPDLFQTMKGVSRHAWLLNLAVCPTLTSGKLQLYRNAGLKQTKNGGSRNSRGTYESLCVPMHIILKAIERTVVDYLALDVGGMELDVVKTLPFNQVLFKMITVENNSDGQKEAVRNFLEKKGYKFIGLIKDYVLNESLFVHESVYVPEMLNNNGWARYKEY